MLELSKAATPEYFATAFREFYTLLHGVFIDPHIKEVLSLPAFLDYCENHGFAHKKPEFEKIYQHVLQVRVDNQELAEGDFPYFLKNLKDRYNSVVIRQALTEASHALTDKQPLTELNGIFEHTVRSIHSIYRGEVFDEGSLGEDADNMWAEHQHIAADPGNFKGVLSGFRSLDSLTNGFFGGELIIIAGFEGTGKSLLCMNMAVNAWLGSNLPTGKTDNFANDGANVVYFSLEMPRSNRGEFTSGAYLNKRVLSCLSQLPFTQLRRGELNEEQKAKFQQTCEFIKEYDKHKKFYVVDIPRGATVEDIEVKYLELKEKFDIDLVIIDYMGLMAGAEDESDWEAQGKIAEGLHELARTYNVPIVSPVQVNRPGGANHSLNKQNYNTTRVARSAMITQNANIVLQIECRDNESGYEDMPIHIIKMRDGKKDVLVFWKDFGNMRVVDTMDVEGEDETLPGMIDLSLGG